jgi:hypothetical protein
LTLEGGPSERVLIRRLNVVRLVFLIVMGFGLLPVMAIDMASRVVYVAGWGVVLVVLLSVSGLAQATIHGRISRTTSRIIAGIIGFVGVAAFGVGFVFLRS